MRRITDFSTQKLMTKIVKYSTWIIFIAALLVMIYLSFVDNFGISPSIQRISTIAVIALVLNWVVWDSRYRSDYDKLLTSDIMNDKYSIHRRYYFARKGWKYEDLQKRIRLYNKDFVNAWLSDVEDITGRTIQEIENGPYRGHDHKFLIWRIKHHKYPKSGLRTPRDVLYVLSVSGSGGMKIRVRKAEHQHTFGRISKIITSLLATTLAASITVTFIQGDIATALLTLLINIVILCISLFFGAASGIKGAKIKLATAEQICELLEEWKSQSPAEEPYVEKKEQQEQLKPEVDLSSIKHDRDKESTIEIS